MGGGGGESSGALTGDITVVCERPQNCMWLFACSVSGGCPEQNKKKKCQQPWDFSPRGGKITRLPLRTPRGVVFLGESFSKDTRYCGMHGYSLLEPVV